MAAVLVATTAATFTATTSVGPLLVGLIEFLVVGWVPTPVCVRNRQRVARKRSHPVRVGQEFGRHGRSPKRGHERRGGDERVAQPTPAPASCDPEDGEVWSLWATSGPRWGHKTPINGANRRKTP